MININKIVQTLKDANQPRSEFVHLMDSFNDPYLVLIGCILSLRTNDKTTYPATLRMLELAKTPQEMKDVKAEDLAKAIYPVGFYENKAKQIIEEGGDVIMIAYTKSLNRYMQQGRLIPQTERHFYYHWQWVDAGRPSADYIIVDEIQDFSREEVNEFIKATKKCFFFFGDTAQSIYEGIKHPLSIKELSEMTGISISYLNSNYRLPKPVAKITQEFVAIDANPYAEAIYQSKETELPRIIRFEDEQSQIEAIIDIVSKKNMKNVGILVPNNGQDGFASP